MWDIRRNLRLPESLHSPFVLHFHFPDDPDDKTNHWFVIENGEIDVCYIDPSHDVDVSIEAGVKDFTRVWMGWLSITQAQEEGRLYVDGPPRFTRDVPEWLGLSSVSKIAKQPPEQRVLRFG